MSRSEARKDFRSSSYYQACQVAGEMQGRARQASPEVLDAELVQASLDGDFASFEQLMSRYERKAFWIAYHVLGRVEESRDVVQEAFVRVHRSLDRFDFSKNFYTWLFRIVTNLAIDHLRKIRSDRTVTVDNLEEGWAGEAREEEGPEQCMLGRETAGRVRMILDRIPPRFRTILALRDLHDISCREIAPILGLSYPTVRWRLHKARQLFKERWERLLAREGSGQAPALIPSRESAAGG
ncbi:MAG: RNA polymerase subunit sigma [Planctomycetota bacterium]|nr:MAG: RNA polymerase subunit sigma [Planctomycetota bacterium]